ncbi:MetS family NSS transporter small subunit [Verrucomicrobiota bacterium]
MEAKAIIMALAGIFLLYGGLIFCIAIAWYHGRNPEKNNNDKK